MTERLRVASSRSRLVVVFVLVLAADCVGDDDDGDGDGDDGADGADCADGDGPVARLTAGRASGRMGADAGTLGKSRCACCLRVAGQPKAAASLPEGLLWFLADGSSGQLAPLLLAVASELRLGVVRRRPLLPMGLRVRRRRPAAVRHALR